MRPRFRVRLARGSIGLSLLLLLSVAIPAAAALLPRAAQADSGGTEFFGHVFPVAGPHTTRGAIGEFGAPRSGGRVHEGFDVVASCGTPLLAVRSGRVRRAGYDPVLYGNFLLIHGEGERRSYFYSHLRRPSAVEAGDRVLTGERVGAVGATGNARTVGCHLHFEIHVNGNPIDPAPALARWSAMADRAVRSSSPARSARHLESLADESRLRLRIGLAIASEASSEILLEG